MKNIISTILVVFCIISCKPNETTKGGYDYRKVYQQVQEEDQSHGVRWKALEITKIREGIRIGKVTYKDLGTDAISFRLLEVKNLYRVKEEAERCMKTLAPGSEEFKFQEYLIKTIDEELNPNPSK